LATRKTRVADIEKARVRSILSVALRYKTAPQRLQLAAQPGLS